MLMAVYACLSTDCTCVYSNSQFGKAILSIPVAPLGGMFSNSLYKVLLMTGLLEVDTVRALFPFSPPPAPGSGPQFRELNGPLAAKVALGLTGESWHATDSKHQKRAFTLPPR